ncbi:MAG: hypothetical protein ACI9DC_003415 [Gammaproteobacteria bacterium]|jgi:hypothetical protein
MKGFNWQWPGRSRTVGTVMERDSSEPAWWHVMGYEGGPPRSLQQVERRFRRLAVLAHPDRGGDGEQLQRLIRARARARVQLTA